MKKYAVEFDSDFELDMPAADKDDGLLVFDSRNELKAACETLDEHDIDYEEFEVTLLPDHAKRYDHFDSCGFITSEGRAYLFSELTAFFAFEPDAGEPDQALMQLCEHLLASFEFEGQTCHAVARHSTELAERIARAYRCRLKQINL